MSLSKLTSSKIYLPLCIFGLISLFLILNFNGQIPIYQSSLPSTSELITLLKIVFIGLLAGTVSGLTGLGGGIVIVPLIVVFFGSEALIDAVVVSFYAVFFNSISATRSKRKAMINAGKPIIVNNKSISSGYVEFNQLILTARSYVIGVILASLSIGYIFGGHQNLVSKNLISLYQMLLGGMMLVPLIWWEKWFGKSVIYINRFYEFLIGYLIGCFSTVIGVGGGTFTLLYFHIKKKLDLGKCSCISNFVGIFVGGMSIVGYWSAHQLSDTNSNQLFDIYQTILMVGAGFLAAPIGVKLQSKCDVKIVKNIIAILLVNSALFIFFRSYF